MSEKNMNQNLEKILSLNEKELEIIFSQLSINEIEKLFKKLNEVSKYD